MEAKSELDLSGKLIIKVQLGDDIRRIPIHNEAITYDELVLMMQRVFRGKLTANDDITLKYKDDDGDLITIFDSADLSFAIQCSRILKLQILLNNEPSQNEVGVISKSDLKKIKVQLQSIRNQVNQLLDLLASAEDNSQSSAGVTAVETAAEEAKEKPPMEGSSAQINKVNPSEFDPLKDKINKSNGNVANENKEQPKPTPTPPTTDRQQVPTPNQQHTSQNPSMVPTAAANISDYYNRTGYPQISTQYGNVPYPQQQYSYGYPQPTPMSTSQVPNSTAYSTPATSGSYQGQSPYSTVQYPQANPYSKAYGQPSAQQQQQPQQGYNMQPPQ